MVLCVCVHGCGMRALWEAHREGEVLSYCRAGSMALGPSWVPGGVGGGGCPGGVGGAQGGWGGGYRMWGGQNRNTFFTAVSFSSMTTDVIESGH